MNKVNWNSPPTDASAVLDRSQRTAFNASARSCSDRIAKVRNWP
jgi:hypothetical protein